MARFSEKTSTMMDGSVTRVVQQIAAPRSTVYRALLDPDAVAVWMVPDDMTSQVHLFEPRVGGAFRVSLTYHALDAAGKTTSHTDVYHGCFVALVPDERVVETLEFESNDPSMRGEMTVTLTLRDSAAGTEITAEHAGVPAGVPPDDNALGWRISLGKLARLVGGTPPA